MLKNNQGLPSYIFSKTPASFFKSGESQDTINPFFKHFYFNVLFINLPGNTLSMCFHFQEWSTFYLISTYVYIENVTVSLDNLKQKKWVILDCTKPKEKLWKKLITISISFTLANFITFHALKQPHLKPIMRIITD